MPISPVKIPRYRVLVGGSLQINGLLPDDTGMFQCFARNLAGEIQTNTYLAVTSMSPPFSKLSLHMILFIPPSFQSNILCSNPLFSTSFLPHPSIYLFALTDLSPWMLGPLLAIFESGNVLGKQRRKDGNALSLLSPRTRPDSCPFCVFY